MDVMLRLPANPYGAPLHVHWLVSGFQWKSVMREPEFWFHLLLVLWTLLFVVRLLRVYRRPPREVGITSRACA